jgi:isoquinoline 1-oxidoreductase alpha subunit
MSIRLRVNGTEHSLDVDPETPLLWALRDVLGLTGTKYGCGEALCGACSVHLDGEVVRACVTPVRRAAGRAVTTIEGLSPDGNHPLQKAWVELAVPQCGFCQAGQIMTAAALLAKRPKPTDQEIDESMGGNLCRCGTYLRIRSAIKKAAGVPPGMSDE